MNRLLALLPSLLIYQLAFAADAEVPQETVGMGGVIAFLVVCVVMAGVGAWYVNKSSKMTDAERSGDKIGQDKP